VETGTSALHGEAAVNSGWWPIIAGLLLALFTAALLLVGALDPFGALDILE
jgi:hypothetical protein